MDQPVSSRSGLFLCSCLLVLVACGGGGGGGGDKPDTTPPDTSITSMPALFSNSTNASFNFVASEANSTFEVSLDGAAYTAATSPFQVSGLTDGPHSLSVRATDSAGNVDASPASYAWTVDTIAPGAEIIFPSAVALTDASTLIFRGTASDQNAITSLAVNGVAATSADSFQTWQVTVPVAHGANLFTVSATDVAGNTNASAATCNVTSKGALLQHVYASKANASGSSIFVYDDELAQIVVIDTATGIRSILSDRNNGTGQAIGILSDLHVDQTNNRLIAADWSNDLVLAINTANGNRTVLSNAGASADTQFLITAGVAYDADNNRLFVVDRGNGSIIEVSLADGQRTLLSNTVTGTGPAFSNPLGIVYDAQSDVLNPRLFVVDSGLNAVVSVDVATGNRSVFSSASPVGSGVALSVPVSIQLDFANSRLLVVDAHTAINQLVAVDLTSGNRSNVISTSGYDVFPFSYSFNATNSALYIVSTSGAQAVSLALNTGSITDISNIAIGNGIRFRDVRSISYDATANRLIVPDGVNDAIYSVSLVSGDRSIISGSAQGSGTSFGWIIGAVLDAETNPLAPRILAVDADRDALFAVDVATGDRTILSDASTGTGDNLVLARDLVHDAANNRVLVADAFVVSGVITGVLRAIDLTTGNRTVVSDNTTGNGINFVLLNSVMLDDVTNPVTPRALVTDGQTFGVVEVDLGNGDRSMHSSNPPTGLGIPFYLPTDSVLDISNARLLVQDFSQKTLIAVDLASGNRTRLSGREASTETILGNGPLRSGSYLEANFSHNLAFQSAGEAIVMIDIVTGERVIITW